MLKGSKGLTGFASVLSRAMANIHQEKNARICISSKQLFFEPEKEHPEIPFIHLDSSSEHKSN